MTNTVFELAEVYLAYKAGTAQAREKGNALGFALAAVVMDRVNSRQLEYAKIDAAERIARLALQQGKEPPQKLLSDGRD